MSEVIVPTLPGTDEKVVPLIENGDTAIQEQADNNQVSQFKEELMLPAQKEQQLSQQSDSSQHSENLVDANNSSQEQAPCVCSPTTKSKLANITCPIHTLSVKSRAAKRLAVAHKAEGRHAEGSKFGRLITCSYPSKLKGAFGDKRPKYELEVKYKDGNDNLHRKRIKFGSYNQNDLCDKELNNEAKTKVIKKAKKLRKYLVNEPTFDKDAFVAEAWSTQKDFWTANLLFNTTAEDPASIDGDVKMDIGAIVLPLQEIGSE